MDALDRQRRLPQIGTAGQRRIADLQVTVHGSEEPLLELTYLHRAGVERVALAPQQPAGAFAHAAAFDHPATRSVGAAAWRAVTALREAIFEGNR